MKTLTLSLLALLTATSAFAAVPGSSEITNDSAVYKNLHEIRIAKEKSLDFDGDIERLSAQEKSHRHALPVRLSAPMDRVMKTSYKPSTSLKAKQPTSKRSRAH